MLMVTKHIFSQNVNQQGSRNLIIHLSVSHLHFQLELHAKTFAPQNVAAVAFMIQFLSVDYSRCWRRGLGTSVVKE